MTLQIPLSYGRSCKFALQLWQPAKRSVQLTNIGGQSVGQIEGPRRLIHAFKKRLMLAASPTLSSSRKFGNTG